MITPTAEKIKIILEWDKPVWNPEVSKEELIDFAIDFSKIVIYGFIGACLIMLFSYLFLHMYGMCKYKQNEERGW